GTLIPFCVADKACVAYGEEIYRLPVGAEASALPEALLCYMESGIFEEQAVEWNTQGADLTRPGVYEIEGSVDGLTVKALLVVGWDLDGDGKESISDVTVLLNHLSGAEGALIKEATADLDGDGKESISDVTALLNYLSGN
ncbi:MAG: dockerin type I repeat-containing protein, partial [Clostridia bacterium]|nr:dockerin type I repeat-containing protein [Clostridia bacterium]